MKTHPRLSTEAGSHLQSSASRVPGGERCNRARDCKAGKRLGHWCPGRFVVRRHGRQSFDFRAEIARSPSERSQSSPTLGFWVPPLSLSGTIIVPLNLKHLGISVRKVAASGASPLALSQAMWPDAVGALTAFRKAARGMALRPAETDCMPAAEPARRSA